MRHNEPSFYLIFPKACQRVSVTGTKEFFLDSSRLQTGLLYPHIGEEQLTCPLGVPIKWAGEKTKTAFYWKNQVKFGKIESHDR